MACRRRYGLSSSLLLSSLWKQTEAETEAVMEVEMEVCMGRISEFEWEGVVGVVGVVSRLFFSFLVTWIGWG